MAICPLPPPVLPRPMPSTAVLPALHHDYPPYGWSDNAMDEAKIRREFAALLKAARAKAGLTQKALAARAGVSQPTIVAWEGATRPTNMVDFVAVAAGLGVPQASLLPGVPPPVPVVFEGPFVCESCRARKRRKRPFRTTRRRVP